LQDTWAFQKGQQSLLALQPASYRQLLLQEAARILPHTQTAAAAMQMQVATAGCVRQLCLDWILLH
jgi:hypothetical protein